MAVLCCVPAAGREIQVSKGLEFGRGAVRTGHKSLLLDLYQPKSPCERRRPGLLLIHGGSFRRGSRAQHPWPRLAGSLAARGYTVASIDYRLQPDGPVPSRRYKALIEAIEGTVGRGLGAGLDQSRIDAVVSAFEDAAAALDWLASQADEHCIDPARLGVFGGSAGAITALHLAYSFDDFGIEIPHISAVVSLWGGLAFDRHLQKGDAPLLIVHGMLDTVVPYRESTQLRSRARSVGVPVTFLPVPDAGHSFPAIDLERTQVKGRLLIDSIHRFLDRELKGAP